MSASAIVQTRQGKFCLAQADIPGRGLMNIGVLLEDPEADVLHLRFRRDMETLAEEEDLEVLDALADDLAAKAREIGAAKLLEYLDTISDSIRITDREAVLVDNYPRALERLYRKNIQSRVLEFRTHLPRYSLRAAAGKFLENEEISEQGWIETPEDLLLEPSMFVAEIAGHSMEPLIPDGSLCVFRYSVAGSRQGRLVLAENRADNSYAVKRYWSQKSAGEQWRHTRIRLESLNPDYPSWDLDPDEDKYRIIAEFVRVLD